MEIRQLRYFVRIVNLGSLSRAALDLHVAQPALSKQVAALEDELDAKLLVRSPRGVTPTEAGSAFYREAQAILRQVARVPDEVRSAAAEPTGTVAVGMPFATSNILAPALVAALRVRHPGIRLSITQAGSAELERQFAGVLLDLSLLYERAHPVRRVEERTLVREDLFLVTHGRSPARRPTVGLAEAVREPLVLPGADNSTRQVVERAAARAGLVLDVVAEVDAPWTIRALVAAGVGATIASRSALYPESAAEPLQVRRITRPALTRALNLCSRRRETPSRSGEVVRGALLECVRELIDGGAWLGATLVRGDV